MKLMAAIVLGALSAMISGYAGAIPLGTVEVETEVQGEKMVFPVALDLDIQTADDGFEMSVMADMGMGPLQVGIDRIAKRFPMPNDNCSSYGQHVLPTVENVSLKPDGNRARLEAKLNAAVWDCQKGVPGGGTTVRWRVECIRLLGKRICTKVPYRVEVKPGPDIKNRLFSEGFAGEASLMLVVKDGQSLALVPSDVRVEPRGDLMRFLDRVLGIFDKNLSEIAAAKVQEAVNAGVFQKALPSEYLQYQPVLKNAGFSAAVDGALVARVEFSAKLSKDQLKDLIRRSVGSTTSAGN